MSKLFGTPDERVPTRAECVHAAQAFLAQTQRELTTGPSPMLYYRRLKAHATVLETIPDVSTRDAMNLMAAAMVDLCHATALKVV